ncbi:ATP-dependent zinc metalloprotease FtsH [compost metagenome]
MVFDKMTHERPYSNDTAKEIDKEVETLIKEASKRAEAVLMANQKSLDALADALLEHETLDETQVIDILKSTTLPKEAQLHA